MGHSLAESNPKPWKALPENSAKPRKSEKFKEIKGEIIGRAGLSQLLSNRPSSNDLGQLTNSKSGESPLNGTPSDDVSTRQKAPSDRLTDLRNCVAHAARESAQDVSIRNEIVGLLECMNHDQLKLARANLIQILDADQVSSLS